MHRINWLSHFTGSTKRVDFAITPDLERELSSDTPTPQRLKVIRDLCGNVLTNHLEDVSTYMWQFISIILCKISKICTNLCMCIILLEYFKRRFLVFFICRWFETAFTGVYQHLLLLQQYFGWWVTAE